MGFDSKIEGMLTQVLKGLSGRNHAVFDADGTLWHGDIGEEFFSYQVKNQLAPGLKSFKNPWKHYKDLEESDPLSAYQWIVGINNGLTVQVLDEQIAHFLKTIFHNPVRQEMRDLIAKLQSEEIDVWICSASFRRLIIPLAQTLGISPENVIAVDAHEERGKLTDHIFSPLPYAMGKKLCLERALRRPPAFAFGNSMGDYDMLSMATEMQVVIRFEPQWEDRIESENKLRQIAESRGWPVQIFTASQ